MADIAFHHGTRVFESAETPVLIRTDQTAVIFLIGTAPDADAAVFPLGETVLLSGSPRLAASLGTTGTLKEAVDAIFDQHGAYVFVHRVEEGGDLEETLSNIVGDSTALTGIHAALACESRFGLKPRILIAPGFTNTSPSGGIASVAVTNGGSGYTAAPAVSFTGGGHAATASAAITRGVTIDVTDGGADYTSAPDVLIGPPPAGGVQATATATVADGEVTDVTITNPGSGYTAAPPVSFSGGGGAGAQASAALSGRVTGVTVATPGYGYTAPSVVFTGGGGADAAATATTGIVLNPIVAEMMGVADKLRAVAFVGGPDTTDEAAVAYRSLINSQRIYIIDPKVLVWSTTADAYVAAPAEARFAGVQCKVDRELGFWWSVSNKPIAGIGGVTRPVAYGDQANYLNERAVATIINLNGQGFRTWGNRVATGDDLWIFLSVRRTADFINEAIEKAYLEFVDKPFSKANLKHMVESGRAFIRVLKAEGAILGGNVWIDQERNTPEEMAQGRVTLGVEFEPPAPMEDIRLIANRNIQYYVDLIDQVLREVNDGALTPTVA